MFVSNELFMDEPFVAGDTYLVNWDGEQYECQAKRSLSNGAVYIGTVEYFYGETPDYDESGNGDESINDDQSTKPAPFAMMIEEVNNSPKSGGEAKGGGETRASADGDSEDVSYNLIMITPDTEESHTVSIQHVNVEKRVLDEQLLPVLYYGEEQFSILDLLIQLASQVWSITLTREPTANIEISR